MASSKKSDSKKVVKAPAKKVATVKAKAGDIKLRPSRIAKLTKKLEKMSATGLKPSSISYAVRVIALNSPCELAGVIMSMDENSLSVHCQKHGSRKELVRLIPRSDVFEITGGVGVSSVIRFFGPKTLTELKSAQVTCSDGGVFNITDMITGDVTTVIASDRINVDIVGSAENVFNAPVASKQKKKKFK